jgi:cobalt-zinc-cadmium efflux system membrane fusion protein
MRALVTACTFAAIAVLAGCGKQDAAPAAAPAAERNPLAVAAPPLLQADLRIGEASFVDIRDTLRVPGRIEVDEQRVARVGASVTGRVTELEAILGQDVRRGQVLAHLNSTELSATQLVFLKSYSQKQLAERAAQRAKQLFEADVIGQAELQRREAELVQAEADLSAARDQLKVLGMSERAILRLAGTRTVDSVATVVSSIDGTVIARKVTTGQVVQPADAMFIIADLSNVWLVAEVPEQRADLLRVGEQIEAEIAALPGRRITGRLTFVSATVNPETRTILVRMDLPNRDREYKPAMLATVIIKGRPQKVRALPASAVVREDNKDFVFVQTGPSAYLMRQVALGPESDGMRTLIGGLREGEKIVLEGAFQLNVERQRSLTQ